MARKATSSGGNRLPKYATATDSTTPSSSPAATVPHGLPSPPSTTTARALYAGTAPMVG